MEWGGYSGGKIASNTVVESFKAHFDATNPNIKEALHKALIRANEDLAKEKEKQPNHAQMGTTFVALYMDEEIAQWVSVGDSPLWLLRRDPNDRLHSYTIKRINQNHSIAGLLELQFKHGEITQEQMDNSPNKHMLTSAITGEELESIELSKPFVIEKDDIFILASDGVETLTKDEIKAIVLQSNNETSATDVLSAVVAKKGDNQDNATIIIVSHKGEYVKRSVAQPATKPKQAPQAKANETNHNLLSTSPIPKEINEQFRYILMFVTIVVLALGIKFASTDSSNEDTNQTIPINPVNSNKNTQGNVVKDNNKSTSTDANATHTPSQVNVVSTAKVDANATNESNVSQESNSTAPISEDEVKDNATQDVNSSTPSPDKKILSLMKISRNMGKYTMLNG